ncbi:DUF3592 domain-containing protein [Tenggerimyces flavus]|uniref:DUF3592 domain-containing protein n=1 Tax=Tenggerimyces flavus TaxID=1708749 RepID=A0ABV7YB27_9ACTN|nr:DUF3592 domain-containing protein [Tenggerimyces flavus]MBM7786537.1 hypothetical protein [Tenggerimyces flavus]
MRVNAWLLRYLSSRCAPSSEAARILADQANVPPRKQREFIVVSSGIPGRHRTGGQRPRRGPGLFAWWRLSGWLLLGAAVLLAILANVQYDAAVQLSDQGIVAMARVIAVDTTGRDAGITVVLTTRGGDVVEGELGLPDETPTAVGAEVSVVYARDDPTLMELTEDGPDFVIPSIIGVLALLLALLAPPSFAGWINWRLVLGLAPYDAYSL